MTEVADADQTDTEQAGAGPAADTGRGGLAGAPPACPTNASRQAGTPRKAPEPP